MKLLLLLIVIQSSTPLANALIKVKQNINYFLRVQQLRTKLHSPSNIILQENRQGLHSNTVPGRAWVPIAYINDLDDKFPTQIEVIGSRFVLWKNPLHNRTDSTDYEGEDTRGWSLMRDYCPHRFAPLSQGRIDEKTGCIECPYHGWQFDGKDGHCTRIPQSNNEILCSGNERISADSFPIHFTGDILWSFLPIEGLPNDDKNPYEYLPEHYVPELCDSNKSVVVREVPYSYDFLVENFMDPAHIPFAHHSLQGKRSDARNIPMQILTNENEYEDNPLQCEVYFEDVVSGRERAGVVSMTAPFIYHFRTRRPSSNNNNSNDNTHITNRNTNTLASVTQKDTVDYPKQLIILTVPVNEGRSRVILLTPNFFAKRFPFNLLPRWFIHAFSMRFIDSDIWVHDQERMIRTEKFLDRFSLNPKRLLHDPLLGESTSTTTTTSASSKSRRYSLMTSSDLGCIAWRKFWLRHL